MIEPKTINYVSKKENDDVTLEYKYNLLDKKYAKKEGKKDVRLVAIKVTNNSGRDLIFGRDMTLIYADDKQVFVMDHQATFKSLKQSPASYLWYLLLTPINFTTSSSNGTSSSSSSFPAGLIIGPGLAGGNMIAAGSANKKFKQELMEFDINDATIPQGETRYGLIGIQSDSFDSMQLRVDKQ
jgi:hypothetical protein